MKHKHKWQFVKEIESYFISSGDKSIITSDGLWGLWTKAQLKFVCECGKVKLVEEKL